MLIPYKLIILALFGLITIYFIIEPKKTDNNTTDIRDFLYTTYGVNIKEMTFATMGMEEEQSKNLQEINKVLDQWEYVKSKHSKFSTSEVQGKTIYSFDIDNDTFKKTLEALIVFTVILNNLGAINRTRILISTLKDLIEDYMSLGKFWKGPKGAITSTPLDINGKMVLAPMECAWALKTIFALCPTGDNPRYNIEAFHSMIAALESKNEHTALIAAHKVNLQKLDIHFIAQNFGILSKIIDTNIQAGLLNKNDLQPT